MTLPTIHVHTVKGELFNVTYPNPDDIDIDGIGYQLAMQCRFNGAVRDYRFYSVAEHCYWGSFIVPERLALGFLLHDAQEAYISDMIVPIKRHDVFFQDVENNLEKTLHKRFGLDLLSAEDKDEIHRADKYMGYIEAQELLVLGFSNAGRPVPQYTPKFHLRTEEFGRMTPREAHANFMRRYAFLTTQERVAV